METNTSFSSKTLIHQFQKKIETEKILNYGLTQLLHQLLEDPKLTQFLAG